MKDSKPPRAPSRRPKAAPDWLADAFRLEKNFALVYGTDTVFDGDNRILIRVSALRHAFGRAVKRWLESTNRKTIRQDDLVFDPCRPDRPYNFFGGIETEPRHGDCGLILELLMYLCSDDRSIYDWVLSWVAYPLKHPGAKMRTSIVMRGPEGGGKNLLWECVRDIYGPYGTLITQAEIESPYTDWISAKLFAIGNEVLSRRERWQLAGKLKNLVTEPSIPIAAKYLPTRVESNHCNLVFLSNDLLPVPLGEGNRRYQVIDAPPPHPDGAAFYRKVAEQVANGGREAFYQYLLDHDLGDFGPHTKPIKTEAFTRAMELSLPGSGLFALLWRRGEIGTLVCLAPDGEAQGTRPAGCIDDIYYMYRHWCQQTGERHLDTQTLFARTLATSGFTRREKLRVQLDGRVRQLQVYYINELVPEACEDLDEWLRDRCVELHDVRADLESTNR